jgi:hypothetical protein
MFGKSLVIVNAVTQVLEKSSKGTVRLLESGSFFNAEAITCNSDYLETENCTPFIPSASEYEFTSNTFCQLFTLSRQDFDFVALAFPDIFENLLFYRHSRPKARLPDELSVFASGEPMLISVEDRDLRASWKRQSSSRNSIILEQSIEAESSVSLNIMIEENVKADAKRGDQKSQTSELTSRQSEQKSNNSLENKEEIHPLIAPQPATWWRDSKNTSVHSSGLDGKLKRAIMKIDVSRKFQKKRCCTGHFEEVHLFPLVWSIFSMLIISYYAFVLPYRVVSRVYEGNVVPSNVSVTQFIFDIAFDCFFIADVYFRARHFVPKSLRIQADSAVAQHRIWNHYKYNGFFSDVLATAFPVSASSGVIFSSNFQFQWILCVCALTRLVRIRRFYDTQVAFEEYRERNNARVSAVLLNIVRQSVRLAIGTYWIACIWLLVGTVGQRSGDAIDQSWLNLKQTPLCYNSGLMMHLLQSIYYVLVTLSTVGYGDIFPTTMLETIVALVPLIGNFAIYSQVTASIATIAASADTAKEDFSKRTDAVNTFLRRQQISSDLRQHVNNYFRSFWTICKGRLQEEGLNLLPSALHRDINSAIFRGAISGSASLLGRMPRPLQQEIMLNLKTMVLAPANVLARTGEASSCLYIVRHYISC